ncbi:MAG: imidazole glycerol phosphate synthase subunit HisH [Patescibacteria group bacterium]
MPTQVVIVDYGLGNLTSVKNALLMVGVEALITRDPTDISDASHLILPGVGSFGQGMRGLKERGLVEVLQKEVLENHKKILGICLGMQLLATKGFEFGENEGLGFLSGEVVKINTAERLPHMGWNNVSLVGEHRITEGLETNPQFYFVHSFHFKPEDRSIVAGVAEYGEPIVSIIEKGNIFGTQFHPEKSHDAGLKILKNFLNL